MGGTSERDRNTAAIIAPKSTTVLVTGANGMVGSCIRDFVTCTQIGSASDRRWVFVDSKDADLRDQSAADALFARHKPTHVIHCAARLSSAADMTARPVDFWMDNVQINNNILRAAHACGSKVVSVLSTVMFAKDAQFPVQGTRDDLFGGELHDVSQSYGFAKRALARLSQWYRTQHGCQFSCVLPSNIFGPHGMFDAKSAPLLNALIAKAEAARASGVPLSVMGTGAPLRQMLYARDLARILVWAVDNFDDDLPLIAAGVDEVAVSDLARMAANSVGGTHGLSFDASCPDGPLRRAADTRRLSRLYPDFTPTPLEQAIRETAQWYLTSRRLGGVADQREGRDCSRSVARDQTQ